MTANFPLTFNQTVQGITDFIEVAVHTILYVRQIYPADLFIRRKKYDTPVFQSRHPALNEYISGAVKAVGDELSRTKVVVVIKNKEQQPLESMVDVLLGQLNMVESQLGQLGLCGQDSFSYGDIYAEQDGLADNAELLPMLRAVNTVVYKCEHSSVRSFSLAVQESEEKLKPKKKELRDNLRPLLTVLEGNFQDKIINQINC
ncbi:DNA-binding protein [Desarmillaria tabescens]|uniref:DNA-binding protein n=1 Tax=Armillaria tabescens TaxID=1929756 RepID=A0AA39U2A5_ARMTA|nr:DNA-binding protein [Desarmillaria tabescens]KAK0465630.1 DNA-binding protein [Desarmillaria tabescens]